MVRKEKQKYLNGMMLEESDRTKPAKFVIMQAGKEKFLILPQKFYPGEYQGNNGETAPIVNNNTSNNENTLQMLLQRQVLLLLCRKDKH